MLGHSIVVLVLEVGFCNLLLVLKVLLRVVVGPVLVGRRGLGVGRHCRRVLRRLGLGVGGRARLPPAPRLEDRHGAA